MARKLLKPRQSRHAKNNRVSGSPAPQAVQSAKARYEACRRRKWTVFDKAIYLGAARDHDVLVLVRRNKTLDFYSSRPLDGSWPPTASDIVSEPHPHRLCMDLTCQLSKGIDRFKALQKQVSIVPTSLQSADDPPCRKAMSPDLETCKLNSEHATSERGYQSDDSTKNDVFNEDASSRLDLTGVIQHNHEDDPWRSFDLNADDSDSDYMPPKRDSSGTFAVLKTPSTSTRSVGSIDKSRSSPRNDATTTDSDHPERLLRHSVLCCPESSYAEAFIVKAAQLLSEIR